MRGEKGVEIPNPLPKRKEKNHYEKKEGLLPYHEGREKKRGNPFFLQKGRKNGGGELLRGEEKEREHY